MEFVMFETILEVSVIIPTHNRADALRATLESLIEQKAPPPWEVIVINNASSDDTVEVLHDMRRYLPLVELNESIPGKSHALNRAISAARGALLLFTDDDVTPSPMWIAEMARASVKYNAAAFCGPVDVCPDPSSSSKLFRSHFAAIAFSTFSPPCREGFLPPLWIPVGPNIAVRTSRLNGLRFREDLGPCFSDSLLSEDTAFAEDLRRQCGEIVYVPSAGVWHRIREELFDVHYLLDRAFSLGRSQIIWKQEIHTIELPFQYDDEPDAELQRLDMAALMNYYYGQIYEHLHRFQEVPESLLGEIALLRQPGEKYPLAPAVTKWLKSEGAP
jgi:glycosyltransferase involved in cell wall biosynthesis